MMIQKKQTKSLAYIGVVITLCLQFVSQSSVVFAKFDQTYFSDNDILIYNPRDVECSEPGSYNSNDSVLNNGPNIDYDGNTVLSDAQLYSLRSNLSFYTSAAAKADIPWEILAAVHYRETGLRNYGPENGYGPYQIKDSSYPISEDDTVYTTEEFQNATDTAATFIKEKSDDKDLSVLDNIKFTLFAYDDASNLYFEQAKALELSDDAANNGEGSPYVMNQMDLIRDPRADPTSTNSTWGQTAEGEDSLQYPANSGDGQYGAFVIYSLLIGADITGYNCVDSINLGANGDPAVVQAEFANYMKDNGNTYSTYTLGVNGCTTLSYWYIGEHTTLTYNRGNGKDVVGNLVAKNPGLSVSNIPIAPSLYSVKGGVAAWGGTGVSYGHVGLVVSVDTESKTATVVQTGSTYTSNNNRSFVSTYSYPNSAVTFVYIGGHLK